MLISLIIFFVFELEVNASSSFLGLETKITSESNNTKIKKMQLALKDFGLYKWNIDWLYKSVENSLLSYQKKTWLIKNNWDYGAWYFWIQTLTSLKEDYPNIFTSIAEKYLKMDKPSTNVRYFFLTAYYSPLPWQKRYTTWSYSWDVRLNWWWKRTASWKWVFEWLLAWPRNYNYWTKIEFEWLGVWVVEDRWWAIVNSWERWHEYDRIDVWMWYWDEWLDRALKWWKRKVKWKVVPNTRSLTMAFGKSAVTKYRSLKIDAEYPNSENVKKLQTLLTEVKLYNWKIDWDFEKIKTILINFQVKNWIIYSRNSEHAWYFWNKTYAALRKEFWWDIFKNRMNELDEDVVLSKKVRLSLDKVSNKISHLIQKKYWNNKLLAIKYRKKIRYSISLYAKKTNNNLQKRKLKYLKSIL